MPGRENWTRRMRGQSTNQCLFLGFAERVAQMQTATAFFPWSFRTHQVNYMDNEAIAFENLPSGLEKLTMLPQRRLP